MEYQLKEKDKQIRTLENLNAIQEQKIDFLNSEIRDFRSKMETNKKWDQLFDGVCEFTTTKPNDNAEHFKREVERLNQQQVRMKEENEQLHKRLGTYNAQIEELTGETTSLEERVSGLRQLVESSENEILILRLRCSTLQNDLVQSQQGHAQEITKLNYRYQESISQNEEHQDAQLQRHILNM